MPGVWTEEHQGRKNGEEEEIEALQMHRIASFVVKSVVELSDVP